MGMALGEGKTGLVAERRDSFLNVAVSAFVNKGLELHLF